jgi:hypothetical protein
MQPVSEKALKVKTGIRAGALGDPCEPYWYAGYRDAWNYVQSFYPAHKRKKSPV